MESSNLRTQLEQVKGKYLQLSEAVNKDSRSLSKEQRGLKRHEKAREIVREVGLQTQQQIQSHISDITTMALNAVFDEPYELVLDFVQRRNKTECDIYFKRGGNLVNPKDASGGGAVDIAAFALRIACWSLELPRKRNTIILDEPMRFVSKKYRDKASMMLKEVSKKLGVQFIIVTHDPVLANYADKTFTVQIKNKVSRVSSFENSLY